MKFFIDTADVKEIKDAASLGILDGVTTNPSLVAKTGRNYVEVVREICELCPGPISAEVFATDHDTMLKEGRAWAKIAPNIVVKIPLIEDGLKVIKTLTEEGIKTNCTLCFSSVQALLAAKAGATFISPFLGRLDDISHDGMELIKEIRTIYDNFGLETEILSASIRSTLHVRDVALAGSDVATIPFPVFAKLIKHPLTDAGLKKFVEDSKNVPGSILDEKK